MLSLINPFILGFRESAGGMGMTYDDDPDSPRSVAYDTGRGIGQRILEAWYQRVYPRPGELWLGRIGLFWSMNIKGFEAGSGRFYGIHTRSRKQV